MGDLGLISGLRKPPRGGHGNPLQYSCLGNPYGQRSLADYSPWGRTELDRTERPNTTQHLCVETMKVTKVNKNRSDAFNGLT